MTRLRRTVVQAPYHRAACGASLLCRSSMPGARAAFVRVSYAPLHLADVLVVYEVIVAFVALPGGVQLEGGVQREVLPSLRSSPSWTSTKTQPFGLDGWKLVPSHIVSTGAVVGAVSTRTRSRRACGRLLESRVAGARGSEAMPCMNGPCLVGLGVQERKGKRTAAELKPEGWRSKWVGVQVL